MPSTGTPTSNTAGGALPVDSSYADMWLPERITPTAPKLRTNSSDTSWGWTSQKTFASRTRRAISCVYCAPKSRINIFWWLFDPVIRGLLGDLDVVHVRFAHPGGGNLDKLAARAQ